MRVKPNDFAQTLGVGAEARMTKETTNGSGNFGIRNVKPDQTVGRMAEATPKEILVLSEERRPLQPLQHGQDIQVLDPRPRKFPANLPKWNAPLPKQRPLVVADVLIQEIHAAS